MPHQRLDRQYARLIKPTRENVPTEYNAQYKRWNKGTSFKYTKENNAGIPLKKGKLVKPGRLHSANDPTRLHAPYHSRPWTTETDKEKVYRRPNSFTDPYSSNAQYVERHQPDKYSISSQSGHQGHRSHSRPQSSTPRVTLKKSDDFERKNQANVQVQPQNHHKNAKRAPIKPKTAWVGDEYNEDTKYSSKSRDSTVYKHNSGQKNSDNNEPVVKASSLLKYTSSLLSQSQESFVARKGSGDDRKPKSSRPSSQNSEKRWRLSFPKDENDDGRQSKLGKASSSVTAFKQSRDARGFSIEERNLKKIYENATDQELKRLLAAIRSIGRESGSKIQNAKNSQSINMHEITLSKEDLDKIRQEAYRGCIKEPNFCRKDVWSTTYGKAFCRKWKTDDYVSPYSGDLRDDKVTNDIQVTDHYIATEFMRSNKPSPRQSQTSVSGNDGQDSDVESSIGSSNGRSQTPHTEPKNSRSMTEWTQKKVDASESERLLREANEIEENEFKHLFKEDGRPKMNCDTTSGLAHKGDQCLRYEDPVWANNTLVSLGSGHWNLLMNHYEGWETAGKFDKTKNLTDMIPKKVENDKYKIMVYDQGEPGPTVKNPLTKEMVFGKYGGGGVPRKTHVSYVTEYMGKYTQMPLPRSTRRSF